MNASEVEELYRFIQRFRGTPCVKCRSHDTWPLSTTGQEGKPLLNVLCDGCGYVETRRLSGAP
jgi:hypothetical protein